MELDRLSQEVWERKYKWKEERSLDDNIKRVAREAAKVEETDTKQREWEEKFYKLMENAKFLPGGRILAGIGTSMYQTLFNCFTLPVIEDSIEGIFESVKLNAIIHSLGGGTGANFSTIRPEGAEVKTKGGTASGPVSFMTVFDAETKTITTGNARKGANMGILNVDHPDIEKFITAKHTPGVLTQFNISVGVTDEFISAVIDDKDWELKFNGKVYRVVRARDLWNLIVKSAYDYAEPGVINLSTINRLNNLYYIENIQATNPCVTGDTLVSTDRGLITIEELANLREGIIGLIIDPRVTFSKELEGTYNNSLSSNIYPLGKAFRTGRKKVIRITTKAGFEIKVTPDHKILTDRGWIEAGKLSPNKDKVMIQSMNGSFLDSGKLPYDFSSIDKNLPNEWSYELGFVLGYLIGDGWLRNSNRSCRVGFTFGENDKNILEYIKPIVDRWNGRAVKPIKRNDKVYHLSYHRKSLVEFFTMLGVKPVKAEEKEVPSSIFTSTEEAVLGFLRGLFSADGHIGFSKDKDSSIRLTSKSKKLLKQVQLLLLQFGIFSRLLPRHREAKVKFTYNTVKGEEHLYLRDGRIYELIITREDVPLFLERIGFFLEKHTEKIEILKSKTYYSRNFLDEIVEIIPLGEEIVYDLIEPFTHSFIANGIVVHNCGEQPLPPAGCCLLGSFNLTQFVLDPFTENARFDFESLSKYVPVAVRLLDNIIEISKYPLPIYEEEEKNKRRMGIGIMGLGSTLAMLGLKYSSPEGRRQAGLIMKTIRDSAYLASSILAKEKGTFKYFDKDKYLAGEFIKRLPEEIKEAIKENGIHNSHLISIAPTGTLSVVANNVSSGVEPIFSLSYKRRVKVSSDSIRGDQFEEYEVMDYAYRLYRELKGDGPIPPYFETAYDIKPEDHLEMLKTVGYYVDSSVSKTINVPKDYPIDSFFNLFLDAMRSEVKGLTVYREGSREGILIRETEEKVVKKGKPERPYKLRGTTYKVKTPKASYYITLNEIEEGGKRRPFEIFINTKDASSIPWITALARLMSAVFVREEDPSFLIDQLRTIVDPNGGYWRDGKRIPSVLSDIANVLEEYLTELGKIEKKENQPKLLICPECGQQTYLLEESCGRCLSCGYSQCS
ncbi:MAG: LAGLIDADG family homing endonuclease [bacterium]